MTCQTEAGLRMLPRRRWGGMAQDLLPAKGLSNISHFPHRLVLLRLLMLMLLLLLHSVARGGLVAEVVVEGSGGMVLLLEFS